MLLKRSCLRLQLLFKERFYEQSLSSTCVLEIQLLVEAMSSPVVSHYTLKYIQQKIVICPNSVLFLYSANRI